MSVMRRRLASIPRIVFAVAWSVSLIALAAALVAGVGSHWPITVMVGATAAGFVSGVLYFPAQAWAERSPPRSPVQFDELPDANELVVRLRRGIRRRQWYERLEPIPGSVSGGWS